MEAQQLRNPSLLRRLQCVWCLQVHNVTKQVEYRGEMVELTESLSHLPAGSQVLISDTTFQRVAGLLHQIKLPAFTFQCSRASMEQGRSTASFDVLRVRKSVVRAQPSVADPVNVLATSQAAVSIVSGLFLTFACLCRYASRCFRGLSVL